MLKRRNSIFGRRKTECRIQPRKCINETKRWSCVVTSGRTRRAQTKRGLAEAALVQAGESRRSCETSCEPRGRQEDPRWRKKSRPAVPAASLSALLAPAFEGLSSWHIAQLATRPSSHSARTADSRKKKSTSNVKTFTGRKKISLDLPGWHRTDLPAPQELDKFRVRQKGIVCCAYEK